MANPHPCQGRLRKMANIYVVRRFSSLRRALVRPSSELARLDLGHFTMPSEIEQEKNSVGTEMVNFGSGQGLFQHSIEK